MWTVWAGRRTGRDGTGHGAAGGRAGGWRPPRPRPPHLRQVRGSAGPPGPGPVRRRRGEGKRGEAALARAGVSIPVGGRWAPQRANCSGGLPPLRGRLLRPARRLLPPGGRPSVRRAAGAGVAGGEEAAHLPCGPPGGHRGARRPVSRRWAAGSAAPRVPAEQSRSDPRPKPSLRCSYTLSFPNNFSFLPYVARIAHPPSRNLRRVEYGTGLTRLLAKLSTCTLRFLEKLEYFFLFFSFFFLLNLASSVGISRVQNLAGFCKAGCRPCNGGVWLGLDSSAAFKICLPCYAVKNWYF